MYGIIDVRSGRVYITSRSHIIIQTMYDSAFRDKWDIFKIVRMTNAVQPVRL
jgi:hypothetical protein